MNEFSVYTLTFIGYLGETGILKVVRFVTFDLLGNLLVNDAFHEPQRYSKIANTVQTGFGRVVEL